MNEWMYTYMACSLNSMQLITVYSCKYIETLLNLVYSSQFSVLSKYRLKQHIDLMLLYLNVLTYITIYVYKRQHKQRWLLDFIQMKL